MIPLLLVAGLSGAILVVFSSATLLQARLDLSHEVSRKAVHVVSGVSAAVLALLIERSVLILSCTSLFILLPTAASRGWLRGVVRPGRTLAGPLWFLFAYTGLLIFMPDGRLLAEAVLVFAFADSAAALAGRRWGKRKIAGGERTWLGTAVFFLVAFVAVIVGEALHGSPPLVAVPVALSVAMVASAAEAVSPSDLDNFFVPVLAALHLAVAKDWTVAGAAMHIGCLVFTVAVAREATRRAWLRADGALALTVVGCLVFATALYGLVFELLLFFVLSSLLTRVGKDKLVQTDALHGRTARQVVALGGAPALAAMVYALQGSSALVGAAVTAVAAACADTWATEIGRHSRRGTYLITTLRPCPPGTSGGVTLLGFAGALAGAATIGASAWAIGLIDAHHAALAAMIAMGANVLDSLLGATVQSRYRCSRCAAESERAVECHGTQMARCGWSALSNEGVNATMAFAAALAFMGVSYK